MIEIVMVACLLALVLGIFIYYWRQRSSGFEGDQASSGYYLAMGQFLERFQDDVRMAEKAVLASPVLKLEIRTRTGVQEVTYTFLAKGGVERRADGKSHLFSFGKPPNPQTRFVFDLKEVGP